MKKLFLLFAALVLLGAGCQGVQNISISLKTPDEVQVGEEFDIVVVVKNESEEEQMLYSIDIGTEYFQGVLIADATPSFVDTFHMSVDGTLRHAFQRSIAPGEEMEVTFRALPFDRGTFSGEFDVCINDGYNCEIMKLTTSVKGEGLDLALNLQDYDLQFEAPESVGTGENVQILASITNKKGQDAILDSIDIAEQYLQGIDITSSSPPFMDSYALASDGTRSHTFNIMIPAGETLDVVFYGKAVEKGFYEGAFDVCMDVGYNCFFGSLTTFVK